MASPTSLDPSLLPTFLAVLEHGRISAAARAVHLSQPAVTARIRRLEEELGAALFTRSVHGVEPTAAGERLGGYAREVQRVLDEAVAEIGAEGHELGPLKLWASTTIAAHVLPSVLARFRARHAAVPFHLHIGNTEEVVEAVRAGDADLGLVEGHARAAGVRLEPWLDDELVPVVGPDATFGIRKLADLARVPILWREPGSGTRDVLARALRKAGVRARPKPFDLVLGTSEAIAGGAAAGLGVAFLSRWALGPHLASGRLRPVPALDLVVRRTFRWARPAGALSPSAETFLRLATRTSPTPA